MLARLLFFILVTFVVVVFVVCVCADVNFIADSLVALGQNGTFVCMLDQSFDIFWDISGKQVRSPVQISEPMALALDGSFIDVTENGSRITIEGNHENNLTVVRCYHFDGPNSVSDGESKLRVFGNARMQLFVKVYFIFIHSFRSSNYTS